MPILGSPPVEILPFQSQPGIYFESLGSTHLVSNEWDLVVYYDMKGYWREHLSIKNGISKLHTMCDLLTDKAYCAQITRQAVLLQEEFSNNNELLSATPRKRVARAPLNIVGNIASSLFGVLDSEYAGKMSLTIDSIRNNEIHLLNLIKNQTSIIDSTTNILKKEEEIIQNKFKEVDSHLDQITNYVDNMTEVLHQQRISQLFMSLAIQVTMMSSTFRRAQTAIIDVMIDTHHGKINPQLLSPSQLKDALATIKDHLPSTLRVPAHRDNLIQLYSLMTVEGRVTPKYAIFRLKLPLFAFEEFEMFRIIPVPVVINGTFFAIKPSTDFIIVNLHRDQFYPLSEQELTTCLSLEEAYHICKQKHPIYRKGANITSCEMSFMNHLPPSSSCQTMNAENTPKWIQLYNPTQWIYSMKEKTNINIVCGTDVLQQILEGAGILKIQANCAIKQELITIQSHHVYRSTIRSSFIPTANLTDIIPSDQLGRLAYSPIQVQSHQDQLEQLQQRIHELKQHQNLPKEIEAVDIHQFALGYLALILGTIIATGLLCSWAKRKFNQCQMPKPVPAPRQTASQAFTVNINEEEG